jgi:hypothetical protein
MGSGIHQAVWLNNHLMNASFGLEETKCVILALISKHDKGKTVEVVAPYIREQMTSYGRSLSVEPYELDENLSSVQLILLAKNSRVMEPMTVELFTEDGKPGIRLVSDEP